MRATPTKKGHKLNDFQLYQFYFVYKLCTETLNSATSPNLPARLVVAFGGQYSNQEILAIAQHVVINPMGLRDNV